MATPLPVFLIRFELISAWLYQDLALFSVILDEDDLPDT